MFDRYLGRKAQRYLFVAVNLIIFGTLALTFSSHPQASNYINSFNIGSKIGFGSGGAYQRENATFVSLCRNSDLEGAMQAVQSWEDRFNHQYHYNWVFLNNEPFDGEFKASILNLASGNVQFGVLTPEMWSMPDHIDKKKAEDNMAKMKEANVLYGDNVPYRHMCRFFSGFFYKHELLKPFKYFWRVDPDTRMYCDLNYDLFRYLREHDKQYAFVISFREFRATVATLWDSTQKFFKEHADYIHPNSGAAFVTDDEGKSFNLCHFWTNFEMGDMDFFRSKQYEEYFQALDKDGGFFYERWGDAPVHSIAIAMMMDRTKIHYFEDVGYKHTAFHHVPSNYALRGLKCSMPTKWDIDWHSLSCLWEAERGFDLGLSPVPPKP